ncbi:hypothetical protein GCM10023092_24180 [Rurimicrobium arvi]|uniref:Signal transduction histidine kinase internal region domain-containing protein n=2 Tax=Rurimicrobium arvi TaxID=2049916 RepID=A0ABP8MZL4_9BACT
MAGIIFLLITGAVIVILLARKRKIEGDLKAVRYENELNRVELASLRAQMNPHFIFNCLNSIRLLTEKHESEAASAYLGKFSKLIRNNLEQARSDRNSLRFEIQTLQLYLEMESLRIKDKVRWTITHDEAMDLDFLEIPSMFLQPYVENAIWHGLMHRDTPGELSIRFEEDTDKELLRIVIEDNGIGRAASAVINQQRSKQHQSLATRINEERVSRMNKKDNDEETQVVITDLFDNHGNAAGTRVFIQMPL